VPLYQYSGKFTDGSFVNDYKCYSSCYWLISPPNIPWLVPITVTITYLNVEEDYDFVTFYDGDTQKSQVIASLTGSVLEGSFTSSTPSLLTHFTTDSTVTAPGFEITYKTGTSSLKQYLTISCMWKCEPGIIGLWCI
jgi:hypothetical protein